MCRNPTICGTNFKILIFASILSQLFSFSTENSNQTAFVIILATKRKSHLMEKLSQLCGNKVFLPRKHKLYQVLSDRGNRNVSLQSLTHVWHDRQRLMVKPLCQLLCLDSGEFILITGCTNRNKVKIKVNNKIDRSLIHFGTNFLLSIKRQTENGADMI